MKKLGVFIGRLNPLHIGHKTIIKNTLEENDFSLVFLGSANIIDERNPFSLKERKDFVNMCFFNDIENKKLIIDFLNDYSSDEIWVENLSNKIKNYIKNNDINITFYCGDLQNDYAILVIKKYLKKLDFKNISFKEILRKEFLNKTGEEVSSTKVRELLKNGNFESVGDFVPKEIYEKIILLWKQKYQFFDKFNI